MGNNKLIQKIIINLSDKDIKQSAQSIMEIFDEKYRYSFNLILSQIIYEFIDIRFCKLYFSFMKEIETFEEKNYHEFNIFHVFLDVLQSNSQRKSCYLIDYMIKEKYADSTIIKFKGDPYFVHYLNQKEIDNMFISQNLYVKQLKENYEELSKNDWELYKKLIEEGHNPSKLAKMIRDDEIDKLQEISSQNDFDFNKNIEPSIYERCSFIDHWVSLIDYAAFFSSVKCFKYLLMNGANVKYTGKYAVAGGNEEIIHLCEQNHSSFEGACETAIEFHRNDIFKYFYDNKLKEINNLEELGKFCIFYQNYEIFSFLLKEGMNINDDIINEAATIGNMFLTRYFLRKYQQPKYILMSASKSVNFELVQFILQLKGIDINAKDRDGKTALIYASRNGHTEIVKLLLEQEGIDINVKDIDGKTALMLASKLGHIEIVKLLLEQEGIDINAKNKDGNTALIYASLNGHLETVKILLEQKGIDINAKDNGDGYTALMWASKYGPTEIVKLLLEQEGIDINAKDKYGKTALIYASRNGHTEIVQLLLEQEGIDINAKDRYGKTALIYASRNGHTEIVKLLLEQEGIDIKIP